MEVNMENKQQILKATLCLVEDKLSDVPTYFSK